MKIMDIFQTIKKLRKNGLTTLLGVAGLIVGLVCVIYISLWIADEISYDRFHSNNDRIFVVHAYLDEGTGKSNFNGCPPAVGPAIKNEYPEVENICRYIPAYFQFLISSGEQKYMENTAFSEFSLFDIFSFPFIYGNTGEEGDPNRIILTETVAEKYFGSTNPVGKPVSFDNRYNMTVVGVIKDIPQNSSLTFNAIIPIENLKIFYSRSDYLSTWYNNSYTTFGLLKNADGFDKVASNITRRIQKEIPESTNYLRAYKFKDGYLYEQKHIQNVRIFILIALMVLLAATLNFVNLYTARSSKQAKETGLRKTIGASRGNIARLIYTDVALMCFVALLVAALIALAGLPFFEQMTGKTIEFSNLFSVVNISAILAIFILTVALAGSYPAFFLSSFTASQTLSRNYQTIRSRGLFRNTLIITMFIISIILLSATLVISKQTTFLQNLDLGYEKDQLMYISLNGKLKDQVPTLKEEIGRSSDVLSSCMTSYLPVMIGNNGEGWKWEGKNQDFKPLVTEWQTDEDLVKTLGAKMAEGNFFTKNQEGIVINRTFAKMIGWSDFTGKYLTNNDTQYKILGVINDIRFNSLTEDNKPMVISMGGTEYSNYLIIRVNTKNIASTIDYISKTCQKIEPVFPVKYSFLNDEYIKLFSSEMNLSKLVGTFSSFAIIVLCLGLLGLVMFFTEQKTKEIGIRKCLGENVLALVFRVVKPFFFSGLVAGLIAIPIAWIVLGYWLSNYADHIQLNILVFILSCVITIALAVLTVIWQSLKVARRNPVEALRYE